MFDFAIDSKLRGCDVVNIKIGDVVSGGWVSSRAIIIEQKTDAMLGQRTPLWVVRSGRKRRCRRNTL